MADAKQTLAELDAEILRQDLALIEQVEALRAEAGQWIARVREMVRQANAIESTLGGHQVDHARGAISATVSDLAELLPAITAHRRRHKREAEEAENRAAREAEQVAEAHARREQRMRSLERMLAAPPAGLGRIDLRPISELFMRRR